MANLLEGKDAAMNLLSLCRKLEQDTRLVRQSQLEWRRELYQDLDSYEVISQRSLNTPDKEDIQRRSKSQFRSNFIPVNHNYLVSRLARADEDISISELDK